MAKKVTLDTLDIEEASVSTREEPVVVKEAEEKPSRRSPASLRFRLLCAAAVLLVGIGAGASWWIWSGKKDPSPTAAKRNTPLTSQDKGNFERVNDFMVPLRTVKGQQRVAVFDLAFELNAGKQGVFNENRVRIRSSIYLTVHQKTNDAILGPGSMNTLKEEIVAELEKYLGKDSIRKIYFTKYMVL